MFDITYTKKDIKKAEKRAYQKGYRAGKKYDAVGKAMKKAMNDWHKTEQTGLEVISEDPLGDTFTKFLEDNGANVIDCTVKKQKK